MATKTSIIPDIEMSKLVVAEYSTAKNEFRIETLSRYISVNINKGIFKEPQSEFYMIGIFKTEQEATEYISDFKGDQNKYETDKLIKSIPDE